MATLMALLLAGTVGAGKATFDHQYRNWAAFLGEVVQIDAGGRQTRVDYARAAFKREALDNILGRWSAVGTEQFAKWGPDQRLAFLLNAYNAWTIDLILTEYPDLDSIRDLGSLFSSPWKKRFVPLFGDTVSLDHIEHDLIRGRFSEPRIHFAINCASCGCPALRAEPYRPAILGDQLSDARDRFLGDRSRNRLEAASQTVKISPIFKWYREDFAAQSGSLRDYLAQHGQALADDARGRALLDSGRYRIRYTDYDWQLNDVNRCQSQPTGDS